MGDPAHRAPTTIASYTVAPHCAFYHMKARTTIQIENEMPALDEYFAGLDESTRAAFERIRFLAFDAAPDAEQGTSYGMPALKYAGRPLLGFRVAKEHLSIFPFSAAVVDAVRDRLAGL